ncbi:MAG: DUF427 domain-containing protein [Myxococcota bacterium]
MRRIKPIKPQPGQESVWAYPRPAVVRPTDKELVVVFDGQVIAKTTRGHRVLETSHPPTYYIPLEDVMPSILREQPRRTMCEWKGECVYLDVVLGDRVASPGAWRYDKPTAPFSVIQNSVGFYAGEMDVCTVDGETVTPQEGDFYGGWITKDVVGPFKGPPGTWGW